MFSRSSLVFESKCGLFATDPPPTHGPIRRSARRRRAKSESAGSPSRSPPSPSTWATTLGELLSPTARPPPPVATSRVPEMPVELWSLVVERVGGDLATRSQLARVCSTMHHAVHGSYAPLSTCDAPGLAHAQPDQARAALVRAACVLYDRQRERLAGAAEAVASHLERDLVVAPPPPFDAIEALTRRTIAALRQPDWPARLLLHDRFGSAMLGLPSHVRLKLVEYEGGEYHATNEMLTDLSGATHPSATALMRLIESGASIDRPAETARLLLHAVLEWPSLLSAVTATVERTADWARVVELAGPHAPIISLNGEAYRPDAERSPSTRCQRVAPSQPTMLSSTDAMRALRSIPALEAPLASVDPSQPAAPSLLERIVEPTLWRRHVQGLPPPSQSPSLTRSPPTIERELATLCHHTGVQVAVHDDTETTFVQAWPQAPLLHMTSPLRHLVRHGPETMHAFLSAGARVHLSLRHEPLFSDWTRFRGRDVLLVSPPALAPVSA